MLTRFVTERRPDDDEGHVDDSATFDTIEDARKYAGYPDPDQWEVIDSGVYVLTGAYAPAGRRGLWIIAPRGFPETDAERLREALNLAINGGGAVSSKAGKQWHLDQIVRICAGERYEEIISAWRTDRDGHPDTYVWDCGTEPEAYIARRATK